jgi:hypothetical protein
MNVIMKENQMKTWDRGYDEDIEKRRHRNVVQRGGEEM